METTENKPAPKWKRILKWMKWTTWFVVVFATPLFTSYWLVGGLFEREKQRIVDRGEPLRLNDLYVGLKEEEDAGPLLHRAVEKYQDPDEAVLNLIYAEPSTPPGDYPAFREALEQNREVMALMRKALERPRCRLGYRTHRLSELLRAECLQSLGTGDHQKAYAAVVDGLKLSKLLSDDPVLKGRSLSISSADDSLKAMQELIGYAKLNQAELSTLDQHLAELTIDTGLRKTVLAERALLLSIWEPEIIGDPNQNFAARNIRSFIRREWVTFYLRKYSDIAELIDQDDVKSKAELEEIDHQQSFWDSANRPIRYLYWSSIKEGVQTHQQRIKISRFALRVERYRQQHSKLPQPLTAVCDQQLPTVPLDLLKQKPLIYEPHEHGFIIRTHNENVKPEDEWQLYRFEVVYPATRDLHDDSDASKHESSGQKP